MALSLCLREHQVGRDARLEAEARQRLVADHDAALHVDDRLRDELERARIVDQGRHVHRKLRAQAAEASRMWLRTAFTTALGTSCMPWSWRACAATCCKMSWSLWPRNFATHPGTTSPHENSFMVFMSPNGLRSV